MISRSYAHVSITYTVRSHPISICKTGIKQTKSRENISTLSTAVLGKTWLIEYQQKGSSPRSRSSSACTCLAAPRFTAAAALEKAKAARKRSTQRQPLQGCREFWRVLEAPQKLISLHSKACSSKRVACVLFDLGLSLFSWPRAARGHAAADGGRRARGRSSC